MKEYYELIDHNGVISSPHQSIEEAEDEFYQLCREDFEFASNIQIVKVVRELK